LVTLGWFGEEWNRRRFIGELFLLSVLLLVFLVLLSAHLLQFRYFLPVLPLLVIWASKGIERLSRWAKSTASNLMGRPPRRENVLAVGLQCISCLVVLLFATRGAYVSELTQGGYQNYALKEAGLWLNQNYPGSRTIMTTNSIVIPYYAKGIMMALPYASSSVALRYIHKKRPDFVVLEGRTMKLRPYIQEWIEKGIPDATAQRIYSKGSSIEDSIAVFRFSWISPSQSISSPEATAK
jgi:hypothetical protein